jgi:hypothetical protein
VSYQLGNAKVWDGTQWVAALGGSQPWWADFPKTHTRLTANATASATVNTKGAWTELEASTSKTTDLIWVRPSTSAGNTLNTSFFLDVGIGAAGSEMTIISNLAVGYSNAIAAFNEYFIPLPVSIPAGSRIAARGQSQTSSQVCALTCELAAGSGTSSALVDTIGDDPTTTTGLVLTAAFTEVVASTSVPYSALFARAVGSGATFAAAVNTLTIGVGPSGSEVDYAEQEIAISNAEIIQYRQPFNLTSGPIPAGSRIAAKTSSPQASITYVLYGVRA